MRILTRCETLPHCEHPENEASRVCPGPHHQTKSPPSAKARVSVPGTYVNSRRMSRAGKHENVAAVSFGSSLCWWPVHCPRGQSPGPCSLPSVLAQEVPQVRKPVLCRSSLPWGTGPTWILPALFFSSSLSRLRGGLSFSAGYLRYPAALGWCSVKIVPVLSVVLMYLWVEWTLRSSTSPLQSPPVLFSQRLSCPLSGCCWKCAGGPPQVVTEHQPGVQLLEAPGWGQERRAGHSAESPTARVESRRET